MGAMTMWAALARLRLWLEQRGRSGPRARPRAPQDDCGQATTEYALVLLGVAAVAMALTTWAGGGKIGSFLDAVFDRLLSTSQ